MLRLIKFPILLILFSAFLAEDKGNEKVLIFPFPQEMEVTDQSFALDESLKIIVPPKATESDMFLARFLVRELSDKYSIAVMIEERADVPANVRTVVMGSYTNPLVKKFAVANKLDVSAKNPGTEGYYLHVGKNSIVIAGADDAGAFYGLQSLRQLINAGNGKSVQGVKVKDWPAYPFRAIRLYVPGPDNIPYFKRFMRDFMALYKYNKVVMEVNCMRLDKHPEVNAGWIEFSKYMKYTRSNATQGVRGEEKNSSHYDAGDGYIIEKNDIRDLVRLAGENHIEVIPEIPSLTHGYYLLTRHPELAEYPGDIWPDTYCPSNPASYDLMFDVYDEYIDVIKPKMIHIGHDEWWGAPLGVCPRCKDKDFSELFAGDINKIHGYLAKKGVKVAMWGDYLLESVRKKGPQNRRTESGLKYQTPGGTRPEVVKEKIPKDILIFNWFWDSESKEMELHNFGFKQIYGNFTPTISNWKERTKKFALEGGAPSSWASVNEFNDGKDLIQDYIGCANFVWSTHIIDQYRLADIVKQQLPFVRSNLNLERIPSSDGDPVVPVDITPYLNISKNSKAHNVNLSTIITGDVNNARKSFSLAAKGDNCAIAVGTVGVGDNPFPASVTGIKIDEDVSSLIFLQACAVHSENQKAYFNIPNFFDTADLLGWYEVVFEDGFRSIIPIQYGVNILEWNPGGDHSLDKKEGDTGSAQNAYSYKADPVKCSSSGENPITFYAFEWVNPRFGKKIKEVNIHGTVNYMATQQNYGVPEYAPMKTNAIFVAGISKVKARELKK